MVKVLVSCVHQATRAMASRAAGQSQLRPPQDGSQHSCAGTQAMYWCHIPPLCRTASPRGRRAGCDSPFLNHLSSQEGKCAGGTGPTNPSLGPPESASSALLVWASHRDLGPSWPDSILSLHPPQLPPPDQGISPIKGIPAALLAPFSLLIGCPLGICLPRSMCRLHTNRP